MFLLFAQNLLMFLQSQPWQSWLGPPNHQKRCEILRGGGGRAASPGSEEVEISEKVRQSWSLLQRWGELHPGTQTEEESSANRAGSREDGEAPENSWEEQPGTDCVGVPQWSGGPSSSAPAQGQEHSGLLRLVPLRRGGLLVSGGSHALHTRALWEFLWRSSEEESHLS